jgi:phospholipid transport system substrate-binding protein
MTDRFSRAARLLGALSFLLLLTVPAVRATAGGPEQFIESLGAEAIEILKKRDEASFTEREAHFHDLLVGGFDMQTISRFVLGRHVRALSEEQFADYYQLFVDFIVRIYSVRFDGYAGETLDVITVIDDPGGDSIVRTHIVPGGGGPEIRVDWRVREREGIYKVIDVYVEGISMLNTQRSEFAAVIERQGVDGLLAELRERIDATQPATASP